jgi:hydrogenase maturation protein HypF
MEAERAGAARGCRVRRRVRCTGIVQGVGFRPFTRRLAAVLGLDGFVRNDAAGVLIEVEGPPAAVTAFVVALQRDPPPLAVVEDLTAREIPATRVQGFEIRSSAVTGARTTAVAPDMATCADCRGEVLDPTDRRFRYPFTNCTSCGPRFTIVTAVPYDRPATTMASFPMCADCRAEYDDPTDRRFHAQPVCCPACGPTLALERSDAEVLHGDAALIATTALLADGGIAAVKGLGGYHLACDATDDEAVARLRARKHREDRPFALLVADVDAAAAICALDADERRVLTSPRAPIVLLARRRGIAVAPGVAPGNTHLGVLLPPTPLHDLLARALDRPLVLTSGNRSDEPIAYRDEDARRRLSGIADAVLVHDRPIHVRTDDSVVRVWRGAELPIRRSRGHAPQPLPLRPAAPTPILACGAELKHTFCLARGRHAIVSHHIGDLRNHETLTAFRDGVAHYQRLFDLVPTRIAHDLHPEYLSTKTAVELADGSGAELVGVQHHHAHIAACLADNGATEPVIGLAFDGTGFGTDGTVWGGEVLVADLLEAERVGHLRTVPLPGGEAAIREPWRMAAVWLDAAFDGAPPDGLAVQARHAARWGDVLAIARSGVASPPTSSVGRLFDAVAALLGVRDRVTYEGQAAVELEQLADPAERSAHPAEVDVAGVLDGGALVRGVVGDLTGGVDRATIAARFHQGLADLAITACLGVRERTGLGAVALSGGVFQNLRLLDAVADGLAVRGFRVLTHRRVPPNDGGISLGQAAVAAARAHR